MRFLLQQGWGMMSLDNELIEGGVGSGVILSPRVSSPEQLARHAQEIRTRGGKILFDPQFYVPRTGHERILQFPYWAGLSYDTGTFDEAAAGEFCSRVIDYQVRILQVDELILPGTYTNTADERWRDCQARFAEEGARQRGDSPVYSTIAVGPDVVRNRSILDSVVDETINFPVDGVYVLTLHPGDSFLAADEDYLYALLDAFLSIRESHKEVLMGYANQQALLFASVGVGSIASGNFRNVRSFNPEIFDVQEEDDRQRATWYYDAGTLSEFRIQALQLAYRRGLRELFGPSCPYCQNLLSAAEPTSVGWTERDAFRHFLYEMSRQWLSVDSVAPNRRLAIVRELLASTQLQLQALTERGVVPGERSFQPCFEPCSAALEALRFDRAMSLQSLI